MSLIIPNQTQNLHRPRLLLFVSVTAVSQTATPLLGARYYPTRKVPEERIIKRQVKRHVPDSIDNICHAKKAMPSTKSQVTRIGIPKFPEELMLLRGTIVNRTYGIYKNLYVWPFLLTIFGPVNYGPP